MTDAWADFPDADPSATKASGGTDEWGAFPDAKSGVGQNLTAGINEAIADTIGAPVDVVNWGAHHNLISMAINAASRALGYGDIDKSEAASEARQPKVPFGGSESIKRAMGVIGANPDDVTASTIQEKLARSAGTGVAMVAAPEFAARDAPTLASSAYRALKGSGIGALSGVGSEAAGEIAPPPLKPLASLIGGLGAGLLPSAVTSSGKSALGLFGALSDKDVESLAAKKLTASAAAPDTAQSLLGDVSELVPGSKPTSFQATGDSGLGQLEQGLAKKYPTEFAQRAADQNAARVQSLGALQPTGDPNDVGEFLRRSLRTIDEAGQGAVDTAAANAREQADRLGGALSPEDYGSGLRESAQAAVNAARAHERALWQAIDPEGNLTVDAGPIKTAAADVFSNVGRSARPLSQDEQSIRDAVGFYGQSVPFRDVGDLRSWVSDAMRQELRTGGNTQAYARLSRLRGAIEDAITGTAEEQARAAPETIHNGLQAVARNLQRDADNWRAARAGGAENFGVVQSTGTGGVSSRFGAPIQSVGGLPDVTGNQGIPNARFDADAASRLKAATEATRNRVDTFGTGPVGQILRKAGRQDQYRLPDSAVASRIFRPGNSGFESVQAYRNAVGDDKALLALQDYAASSFRKQALNPDGTIDQTRANSWLRSHANALKAFPDLQTRFRDAASASNAVAEAMAARRAAVDAYDSGSLAKVMRTTNADDATRTIAGIFNSRNRLDQMQALARTTAGDPNARAGLRKAVADYIQQKFVSPAAAGSSGDLKGSQFVSFMQANGPTLRKVFSEREVGAMNAVAADLLRSSAKAPAMASSGPSVLRRMLGEMAGAATGTISSLHSPFAGWLGAKAIGAMRDAGMRRVDDLLRDAMLNPDLAYALLAKGKNTPSTTANLVRALKKVSVANAGLATIAAGRYREPVSADQIYASAPRLATPGSFSN